MDKSKAIKQHYVPRFYLMGFSNKKKKGYYLHVYKKENMEIFPSDINKIGQENYFYDISEERIIEKIFSKFESKFNATLKNLIKNEDLRKLTKEDRAVLSVFMAIQFLRTKEHRLHFKEVAEKILNLIGSYNVPNFKEGSIEVLENSLKGIHLKSIFESYQNFSEIFMKMSWKLCVNKTNIPFWTSDNPCASYNELESDPYLGNIGFLCKGFQLHFPLSSKLVLILMNPDLNVSDLAKSKGIKNKNFKNKLKYINKNNDFNVIGLIPEKELVSSERVTFENNLQIISSTQFIFSKDSNFDLANKYLIDYPFYRDKNRKRFKVN